MAILLLIAGGIPLADEIRPLVGTVGIMPDWIGTNTNVTTVMIAGRVSDFIREGS